MRANSGGKPAFGPLMTKEIFWAHWSRKFYHLKGALRPSSDALKRCLEDPNDANKRAHVVILALVMEDVFAHITAFKIEAEQIGYNEEAPQSPEASRMAFDPAAPDDPFRDIAVFRALVDGMLYEAGLAKTGKPRARWPAWQTLPLDSRTKLNDLIHAVSKEKEDNRWEVDTEFWESVTSSARASLAETTL